MNQIARIKRLTDYLRHKSCLQATWIFWDINIDAVYEKLIKKPSLFSNDISKSFHNTLGLEDLMDLLVTMSIFTVQTSNNSSTKYSPSFMMCCSLREKNQVLPP